MDTKVEETQEVEADIDCNCAVSVGSLAVKSVLGIFFIMFLSFWVYMAYRNDERKLVTGYLNVPSECRQKLYGYLTNPTIIEYDCVKQIEVKLIDKD